MGNVTGRVVKAVGARLLPAARGAKVSLHSLPMKYPTRQSRKDRSFYAKVTRAVKASMEDLCILLEDILCPTRAVLSRTAIVGAHGIALPYGSSYETPRQLDRRFGGCEQSERQRARRNQSQFKRKSTQTPDEDRASLLEVLVTDHSRWPRGRAKFAPTSGEWTSSPSTCWLTLWGSAYRSYAPNAPRGSFLVANALVELYLFFFIFKK